MEKAVLLCNLEYNCVIQLKQESKNCTIIVQSSEEENYLAFFADQIFGVNILGFS